MRGAYSSGSGGADAARHRLGARVLDALGTGTAPTDPGRPILAGVQAPRESWVAEAWDLDDEPRDDWLIAGKWIAADEVRRAQGAWYRENSLYLSQAVARLGPLLARWRA